MKKTNVLAALAVALGIAGASAATARDLRGAPGSGAPAVAYTVLYSDMQKYLPEATGGALNLTLLGPEIVDLRGVKNALESGLIDMGQLLPLYYPSELPNWAMLGDFVLLGKDATVMASATTEFMVFCGACQKELRENGLVFTGSHSTDSYVLLTNTPIRNLADIKGKRLRSGGAPFSRWAEQLGATPVNVPYGDVFESMSQGVIDGAMMSVTELYSMRLIDVTKYVTELPLGVYSPAGSFVVRAETWDSFSPELRTQFVDAAERASVKYVRDGYVENANGAREKARADGIEFIEPAQDLVEASERVALADLDVAKKISVDLYKIEDIDAKYTQFLEILAKWEQIVAEADGDVAKVIEARHREIWSKVDLSTYGQ